MRAGVREVRPGVKGVKGKIRVRILLTTGVRWWRAKTRFRIILRAGLGEVRDRQIGV